MPAKTVVQYTCDRCTRVWYGDPKGQSGTLGLKLELKVDAAEHGNTDFKYDCLCKSCEETVESLVKSLGPLKPRDKRAKKKDETNNGASGQGESPAANPDAATKDGAPVQPSASTSSAPAPSSAGASSGAGGRPPAPSTAPHPRR